MSTPDPRRGDEPGDPDVTPGQPNPNTETGSSTTNQSEEKDDVNDD